MGIQPGTRRILENKEQDSGWRTNHNTREDSNACSLETSPQIVDGEWRVTPLIIRTVDKQKWNCCYFQFAY